MSNGISGGAKEEQAGTAQRIRGEVESSSRKDTNFSPARGRKAMTFLVYTYMKKCKNVELSLTAVVVYLLVVPCWWLLCSYIRTVPCCHAAEPMLFVLTKSWVDCWQGSCFVGDAGGRPRCEVYVEARSIRCATLFVPAHQYGTALSMGAVWQILPSPVCL